MTYLLFFVLCIFFTTGVHSYLLYSQRKDRKWSISVHAAQSRKDHVLYMIGHFLGGLFLILFGYQYYRVVHDLPLLFAFACLAALFEWIQAVLPARGKFNKPHTYAAYVMWFFCTALGFGSLIALPLTTTQRLVSAGILIIYMGFFVRAFSHQDKLYFYQMSMTTLIAVAILIMIV